jgi:hypothetical protein
VSWLLLPSPFPIPDLSIAIPGFVSPKQIHLSWMLASTGHAERGEMYSCIHTFLPSSFTDEPLLSAQQLPSMDKIENNSALLTLIFQWRQKSSLFIASCWVFSNETHFLICEQN